MTVAESSLNLVRQQLQFYQEQAEPWQTEDTAAEHSFDLESLLAFGLSVFEFLHRLDRAWRAKVYAGALPYDAAFAQAIEALYRLWLQLSSRVLDKVQECERRGCAVGGAEELRQRWQETQAIVEDRQWAAAARRARRRWMSENPF
jgi:hypothetical protein